MNLTKKRNVTITLSEEEYEVLNQLKTILAEHSFKAPNTAETIRYAISFCANNLYSGKEIVELKKQLLLAQDKIELFEQAFLKFSKSINENLEGK